MNLTTLKTIVSKDTMKAWTDYPVTELGDAPRVEAPIREVTVLSYDGDKYCKVQIDNVETEIKAGYLYTAPGRLGEVPIINTKDIK